MFQVARMAYSIYMSYDPQVPRLSGFLHTVMGDFRGKATSQHDTKTLFKHARITNTRRLPHKRTPLPPAYPSHPLQASNSVHDA